MGGLVGWRVWMECGRDLWVVASRMGPDIVFNIMLKFRKFVL